MNSLENELRDALAARADELPAGAARRLAHHDYRPRTRDLRPPVAAGALVAAGVTAAVVVAIELGPQTSEAFAGWSAKPTAAPADQISTAEADCKQQLSSAAAAAVRRIEPKALPATMLDALPPVLADVRGPFTFVIFADEHNNTTCISGPQFTSVAGAHSTQTPAPVPAGQITVDRATHTARAGNAYSFIQGHTGSGVTATTLTLDDGSHVQTSAANGWFVAWWPGSANAVSAQVTTASGTTTQPLPKQPTCPGAPAGADVVCSGGAQAGSGSASGIMSVSRSGS
jgi:hypothetical protein